MRQKAKVLPALPERTVSDILLAPHVWAQPFGVQRLQLRQQIPHLLSVSVSSSRTPATAEILISKTLIRNAPNTDGIVRDEIGYIYASLLETAYMTGNGAGRPLGLFTASADGISTARDIATGNTATEIKFDGLYEAKICR